MKERRTHLLDRAQRTTERLFFFSRDTSFVSRKIPLGRSIYFLETIEAAQSVKSFQSIGRFVHTQNTRDDDGRASRAAATNEQQFEQQCFIKPSVKNGTPGRRVARPRNERKRVVRHQQTARFVRRSRPGAVALLRRRPGAVARNRLHLPSVITAVADESRVEQSVQRFSFVTVRGVASGHASAVFKRARASVLVPVFEHGEQNETVRVFTVDVVRGDRRVGESGRHGGD